MEKKELTEETIKEYLMVIFDESRKEHYKNKKMTMLQSCKTYGTIDRCRWLDEAWCKDPDCTSCQNWCNSLDKHMKENIENDLLDDEDDEQEFSDFTWEDIESLGWEMDSNENDFIMNEGLFRLEIESYKTKEIEISGEYGSDILFSGQVDDLDDLAALMEELGIVDSLE